MKNDYIAKGWNYHELDTSLVPHKYLDLCYYHTDQFQGLLDLYIPEAEGPVPLIICVSGGGWYFGGKSTSHLGQILNTAIEEGFALVSMFCTSSGKKKFPWQIYEVKTAVRFLRAHAEDYGLNPDAFAFWSPSSGGHLSLMGALTCGVEEFDQPILGYPDISAEVQAVVATYPPTDLASFSIQFQELGLTPHHLVQGAESSEGLFLGSAPEEFPELAYKASPINYITPESPPIFLQHGRIDHVVPVTQSLNFYQKYCKIAGSDRIRLQLIDDADHSDPRFKDHESCLKICCFLREMLLD